MTRLINMKSVQIQSNFTINYAQFASTLYQLSAVTQAETQAGIQSLTKGAEDFFRELAELIFNQRFDMATKVNQDTWDFSNEKIEVQVTARRDAKKIKSTLDTFQADAAKKDKRLWFMLIAQKPDYEKSTFELYKDFSPKNDIYGIEEILKSCSRNLDTLNAAIAIAQKHLRPVVDHTEVNRLILGKFEALLATMPTTLSWVYEQLTQAKNCLNRKYQNSKNNSFERNGPIADIIENILNRYKQLIETQIAKIGSNLKDENFSDLASVAIQWEYSTQGSIRKQTSEFISSAWETEEEMQKRRKK